MPDLNDIEKFLAAIARAEDYLREAEVALKAAREEVDKK